MRQLTIFSFLILFVFFSCIITRSNRLSPITDEDFNSASKSVGNLPDDKQSLLLTFAGDLMAHTVNFSMKNYDLIYTDIEQILHDDDLSFVNVETPVCDALPLSTYPSFNVHTSYLRAAAQAGFDVFSLANNHTNDKNIKGIDGTLSAVRTLQQEWGASTATPHMLAYSGLKENVGEPIQVTHISYKGWNILFCAITEILNSYDSSKERLYYSAPTKQDRAALLSLIKDTRNKYPCDIFVLGLHLNEPEYVRTVSTAKKAWFKQLGEAGIDIIWAHHPHVMQAWETITVERSHVSNENTEKTTDLEQRKVFCMYSMGNFISGQRWHVRYDDPAFYREYTGDAVLLQLTYTRDEANRPDFSVLPLPITQYNEPEYPVVKRFTQEWINTLNEKEKKYFERRLALMKEYLPF